jgi:hypothetical protein
MVPRASHASTTRRASNSDKSPDWLAPSTLTISILVIGQSSCLRAIRDRNFHALSFPLISENRVTTSSMVGPRGVILDHIGHKWFHELKPLVFLHLSVNAV